MQKWSVFHNRNLVLCELRITGTVITRMVLSDQSEHRGMKTGLSENIEEGSFHGKEEFNWLDDSQGSTHEITLEQTIPDD